MMATGHQVVGITFGVGALTLLPQLVPHADEPLSAVFFLGFVLFGSLLPDIDMPNSKLGHKFWRGLLTLFTLAFTIYLFVPRYLDLYREELKVFLMLLLPVLLIIRSHRKMTHSLLFVGMLIGYSWFIEEWLNIQWFYLSGLIIGVISHLSADYLTKRGIPLVYPFSSKHKRFFITFRTGSAIEKAVVYSLVLWNVWYINLIF